MLRFFGHTWGTRVVTLVSEFLIPKNTLTPNCAQGVKAFENMGTRVMIT